MSDPFAFGQFSAVRSFPVYPHTLTCSSVCSVDQAPPICCTMHPFRANHARHWASRAQTVRGGPVASAAGAQGAAAHHKGGCECPSATRRLHRIRCHQFWRHLSGPFRRQQQRRPVAAAAKCRPHFRDPAGLNSILAMPTSDSSALRGPRATSRGCMGRCIWPAVQVNWSPAGRPVLRSLYPQPPPAQQPRYCEPESVHVLEPRSCEQPW